MPSPPSASNLGHGSGPSRSTTGARTRHRDGGFQVATPARSRPPALLVAAVLLIVFFGAVGAALVQRADDRRDVLVLRRTVPVGQRLSQSDLAVVRVSSDPGLHVVAGSATAQVIGRVAATTLLAGTLLPPEALQAAAVPAPGRAIVGLDLKGGQLPLPAGMLAAGAQVRVALTPGEGAQDSDAAQVDAPSVLVDRATVYAVEANPDDGSVHVAIEVGEAEGTEVLRAGAAGRVGLVLLGGAGRGS